LLCTSDRPSSFNLEYKAIEAPPESPTQAITAMTIPTTAAAVRVAATTVTVSKVAQARTVNVQFPKLASHPAVVQVSALEVRLDPQTTGILTHPVKGMQAGIEHKSASSGHDMLVYLHPAVASQNQFLQGSLSPQFRGLGVKVQDPFVGAQASSVQVIPSSHLLGKKPQVPVELSHMSFVQGLLSLQVIGVNTHPVLALQES